MTVPLTVEAAVVGAGPAGLTAAIALAQAGLDTALIAPRSLDDPRTAALLAGSVTALDTLDVWKFCSEHAAPLRSLRLIDDTMRLIRAPEVIFHASEIGLDAFGYSIEIQRLIAALETKAGSLPALVRLEDKARAIEISGDRMKITLETGALISAKLVIGADGRQSLCRAAAGIKTHQKRYPQTALTFNFSHSRPHLNTSTEFHTESGPFTLVPLVGHRSSLVWVVHPKEALHISALDEASRNAEIERRSHSILGPVDAEPRFGSFPLAMETAECFGRNRIALIGEAAHLIPPIGAQGLNLGLRDAAAICELALNERRAGGDIGNPLLLAEYDRLRRTDVRSRSFAVDWLNRTLLSNFLPVQGARGLGLYLISQIEPLRRAVMREGVAPALSQPRLMRGEAL